MIDLCYCFKNKDIMQYVIPGLTGDLLKKLFIIFLGKHNHWTFT